MQELATSQNKIQEILDGPDYFTCERGGRLPKKTCIERQTKGIIIPAGAGTSYGIPASCVNCKQGEKILKKSPKLKVKSPKHRERKCTDCPKIGPIKGRGKCETCYNRWYAREHQRRGPLKARGIKKNEAVPPIDKLPSGLSLRVEDKVEGEAPLPVTVDFREHPELLDALHKATEEEFRESVEAQILWYIKKGLKEGGHE